MMITPKILRDYIVTVYGPRGGAEFARDIGRKDYTVKDWLRGKIQIEQSIINDLPRLARFKGKRNFDLADWLEGKKNVQTKR